MKASENRKEWIKQHEDVACNKCGQTCLLFQDDVERPVTQGLIDAKVYGDYFSTKLDDLVQYRFNLCEECLTEMFDGFKIPVKKYEYDVWTAEPLKQIT